MGEEGSANSGCGWLGFICYSADGRPPGGVDGGTDGCGEIGIGGAVWPGASSFRCGR